MNEIHLTAPFLTPEQLHALETLVAGDRVLLSGTIYTARDAAHQKLTAALANGEPLPFDPIGAVIYYVGPTPPPPGAVIGSAGPTTASRMDAYTPQLLDQGIKGLIGKGYRNDAVRVALIKNRAVYFGATGGAGALLSKRIRSTEIIAYPELGTEAVRRFVVEDFPLTVITDIQGGYLYETGPATYREKFAAKSAKNHP